MPDAPASSALSLERGEDWAGFWIHVTPRARHDAVRGTHGDALPVSVKAPPVSGKANRACVDVLAQALGVPASAVQLDPGARGRRKRVRVRGDPRQLSARLGLLAAGGRLR